MSNKDLIKSGQGPRTAFLEKADAQVMAETMVAFANTEGGTLVIGVNKDGEPVPKKIETDVLEKALKEADFVYSDVWTSMGQEAEAERRCRDFAPFQLNNELMAKAPSHCKILHCLPAKRGEEITDEVIDSPNSRVIEQAGNRMHAQKGLLLWLALQHERIFADDLLAQGVSL